MACAAGRILLGQDFSPHPRLAIGGRFDLGASMLQFNQGGTLGTSTKLHIATQTQQ
jgi:hypothetical protein